MAQPTGSNGATRAGPRKRATVASLTEKLGRATSAVVTDYRGLTVAQLEELRGQLRAQGVEYVVVKNTLARRAAEEAGKGQFSAVLNGPVGLALGYGDLAAPARILNDYFKANRRLPMVGGLVEGQVLDAAAITAVADLPSRERLAALLAGSLQQVLSGFAGAIQSPVTRFAGALDAHRQQLEQAG